MKIRALVVDDEPYQRFLASRTLSRLGYTVAEAISGRAAVKLFQRSHDEGEDSPFDLVLLDMIMEEDFDGLATFQEIIKMYPAQKVLVMSGHSPEGRGLAIQDFGAGWLSKPYQSHELAQAVKHLLDG